MTYRQQGNQIILTDRDKPTNSKHKESTDKEGKFETVPV